MTLHTTSNFELCLTSLLALSLNDLALNPSKSDDVFLNARQSAH